MIKYKGYQIEQDANNRIIVIKGNHLAMSISGTEKKTDEEMCKIVDTFLRRLTATINGNTIHLTNRIENKEN